jgi:hypothetical protein
LRVDYEVFVGVACPDLKKGGVSGFQATYRASSIGFTHLR